MKKFIYSAMAVAMLATTSCKDDFAESFVGEEATVEFSISTPEIGTRAYSDGSTVNELHYAVYDNGELLEGLTNTVVNFAGSTKLQLQLKTGKTYDLVFWADNEEAPYVVDFSKKTMTIDYENSTVSCNDEELDAFYKHETITVEGNRTLDVKLTRPFAQLNIGTSDYAAAKTAGYEPTLSSVTVDAYSAMDLMSGNVIGESNAKTFGYAAIPSNEAFPVKDYQYLAMNYILVGNDKVTSEVTFRYKEDVNTAEETKTVGSVPFQRNYRTNIYGNLLTSTTEVNVEIKPGFNEPANNLEQFVTSKADLKAQLEEAIKNGEKNIVLNALNKNIGDLNYGITTALVPEGVTVTLCNAIVEGSSYGNGVDGTIIFENCTFKNTGAYSIHFDNGNGKVIFNNCELYGWNSFGASLSTVEFYDSKLFGNGTYALIRSYVDLTLENCYIDTTEANHEDAYSEGVEVVGDATITENNVTYVVSNAAALQEALEDGKSDIYLAAGEYTFPAANSFKAKQTLICAEGVVFKGKSDLNINGATVIGATFSNPNGVAGAGTIHGTYKDCTFEGSETLRWCYSEDGKPVIFEDCVFKTDFRGVHFDSMDGDVIFKNCEINGFNAFGGNGKVTFEGCTFGNDKSSYNGLNMYTNIDIKDCKFNFVSGKTNFIDCEGIGKTMNITNSTATLDGAVADIKNFIGGSKIDNNTVVVDGTTL